MAGRAARWIGGGVAAIAVGAVGLGAWVNSLIWTPDPEMDVPVVCAPDTPTMPHDRPIKVLVWNVQYAGSRRYHFFYDGGEAVHVTADDVEDTLDRIAEVLRRENPDLVLLQEVDRGSDRTAGIDQHAALLARVPYPCHLATPYHRAGYVPHPSQQHLGKVDMNLSVFSRYRVDKATRHQLALLDEPWWRQAFNLKRALLEVELPMDDGTTFTAFDTHLSAFSKGDGTLGKQMGELDAAMTRVEGEGRPWLLGGDLNALPPGDDPSRLGAEGAWYAEDVTPVKRLFDRHASVIPAAQYAGEPQRWRTYVPFGAEQPDRTLDYVFHGRAVDPGEIGVRQELAISDHMPIVLDLTVPSADAPAARDTDTDTDTP